MKDHRCFVCKFHDANASTDVYVNQIYSVRGQMPVLLCWNHSVEYFKTGQRKFFDKYKQNFDRYVGSKHDDDILKFVHTANHASAEDVARIF